MTSKGKVALKRSRSFISEDRAENDTQMTHSPADNARPCSSEHDRPPSGPSVLLTIGSISLEAPKNDLVPKASPNPKGSAQTACQRKRGSQTDVKKYGPYPSSLIQHALNPRYMPLMPPFRQTLAISSEVGTTLPIIDCC